MTALLPVGTYVQVRDGMHAYVGRIVGYDTWQTKYEIGARYAGWGEWKFPDRGLWAFPGEVEEITEAEALRVEADT